MLFISQVITTSALLAVAHGQAVLLGAKGTRGSPVSLGLQGKSYVDPVDHHICFPHRLLISFIVDATNSKDANFISDTEIGTNVVNECGRTLLAGNIDIGENTENALAAGNVTTTTAGSRVSVFLQQVDDTGAGPFTCDMDPTGNSIGLTGQTKLVVRESAANKKGIISLKVAMPSDLACTGGMSLDSREPRDSPLLNHTKC